MDATASIQKEAHRARQLINAVWLKEARKLVHPNIVI